MLMITEISPTSINKYFNREFIIVATSVSLVFEGNGQRQSESAEWIACECYNHTPQSAPLNFTHEPVI